MRRARPSDQTTSDYHPAFAITSFAKKCSFCRHVGAPIPLLAISTRQVTLATTATSPDTHHGMRMDAGSQLPAERFQKRISASTACNQPAMCRLHLQGGAVTFYRAPVRKTAASANMSSESAMRPWTGRSDNDQLKDKHRTVDSEQPVERPSLRGIPSASGAVDSSLCSARPTLLRAEVEGMRRPAALAYFPYAAR